jgi:hypothetical protein
MVAVVQEVAATGERGVRLLLLLLLLLLRCCLRHTEAGVWQC